MPRLQIESQSQAEESLGNIVRLIPAERRLTGEKPIGKCNKIKPLDFLFRVHAKSKAHSENSQGLKNYKSAVVID